MMTQTRELPRCKGLVRRILSEVCSVAFLTAAGLVLTCAYTAQAERREAPIERETGVVVPATDCDHPLLFRENWSGAENGRGWNSAEAELQISLTAPSTRFIPRARTFSQL